MGAGRGRVALIGVLAIASFTLFERDESMGSSSEAMDPSDQGTKLAVLPFSNLRSDPGYRFSGLRTGRPSHRVTDLRERSDRPAIQFGAQVPHGNYELDEVRNELAVNFALAGNYLQQGDRMRLTVELIDLENEQIVWREPIEIAYQDAYEMQDLVSERLLARLEISFSEDERDRMTADVSQNPLAYEYYLRSLSYSEESEGNQLAVDMLLQSTELDPTFAAPGVRLEDERS